MEKKETTPGTTEEKKANSRETFHSTANRLGSFWRSVLGDSLSNGTYNLMSIEAQNSLKETVVLCETIGTILGENPEGGNGEPTTD